MLFPIDTKTAYADNHTTTSGILLSATTSPRTILSGEIICSQAGDNHIIIGSTLTQPNQNNIVDTEQLANTQGIVHFLVKNVPPNTNIYFSKGTANHQCNFTLNYVDYDITKATSEQINGKNSTSTNEIFYNGFSQGDITTTIFLFLILCTLFYSFINKSTVIK